MIGKIILILVIVGLLGYSAMFFYENLPGSPIALKGGIISENSSNISYGETQMFYPNMRFSDENISYYIDSSCSKMREDSIGEGFMIISTEIPELSFYRDTENNSEILIGCEKQYISSDEDVVVAGEGGPTKIINSGEFSVVLRGKVTLYKGVLDNNCDYPVVEIHEIMHVFGFDHSQNKNNIMYNFSSCGQRITPDIIDTLSRLYSIESLPDLYFSDINATKRGRYLDFNAEIRNKGLKDANGIMIKVFVGGEEVTRFDVGDIAIGGGRIMSAQNVKLPSRDTSSVTFEIVDNQRELDDADNSVTLSVAG